MISSSTVSVDRKSATRTMPEKPTSGKLGLAKRRAIRKANIDAMRAATASTKSERLNSFAERLRSEREAAGLRQVDIAAVAGVGRTQVCQYERGESIPHPGGAKAIADLLNAHGRDTSAEYLLYGVKSAAPVVKLPEHLIGVAEMVFNAKPNDRRTIQWWALPRNWLQHDLGIVVLPEAETADNLIIYKVEVDSVGYEYNDRVIVDTVVPRLQPGGTFLHWIADGPAISKISLLPRKGKKFVARVEGTMGTIEMPADRLQVIGRIRGLWRKA